MKLCNLRNKHTQVNRDTQSDKGTRNGIYHCRKTISPPLFHALAIASHCQNQISRLNSTHTRAAKQQSAWDSIDTPLCHIVLYTPENTGAFYILSRCSTMNISKRYTHGGTFHSKINFLIAAGGMLFPSAPYYVFRAREFIACYSIHFNTSRQKETI